ncbi:MAG: ABC transporter permease [Polyangiaceae bacterium UTPRO1]|jgi:peptide/nickel transport system permease protein|nr:ABC transporter permease [Myxococcales bacterium]OQY65645.1 MAG: ABC transporter permease [Polyangiaceae bacterium UTPRO1]
MRGSYRLVVGGWLIAVLIVVALGADRLAPYDPGAQALSENLAPPGARHWLGQDALGRDILARVIHGARVSLAVGIITVLVSLAIGTTIGALAGFAGGWIDELAMRAVDVLLAFPGLLLAIALTSVLGPSLRNVVIALSLIGWTGYARLARGEIVRLRERELVEAARALGVPEHRILLRHLVPLLATPLLVQATFGMAAAIVAEASLSFLGLGAQPPTASWGAMLNDGRAFALVAPHLTIFPGLAIMVTVLGLNCLGDGLRDRLDVRAPSGI